MNGTITRNSIIFVILLQFGQITFAQNQGLNNSLTYAVEKPRSFRVMFYNCENLFDTIDDSLKTDEEFLPEGVRFWSNYKYYDKLKKISKVITAVGGWQPPDLVGLCEIENRKVLVDLTKHTPLYISEYKIIHKESPDKRGIDVALLYQPETFRPLNKRFLTVLFKENNRPTRDILYTKGLTNKNDTLHVFVNHWPSRWGGQLESENKRITAAKVLRSIIDSLYQHTQKPNIIIMGDFNDEPENKSISSVLKAEQFNSALVNNTLYNLTPSAIRENTPGTHKYQGNWGTLDQLILSANLLTGKGLFTTKNDIHIFNAPFLLEPDEQYLGKKPYRTFIGFKYNGGYSDHLPVFIDLNYAD